MTVKTDVAIVGGGPGGCVMALYLLEQGITPLVIEKETFPRYHIGESMTGEAGNLLRALGLEDLLVRNGYPRKQGVNVVARNGNRWWVPVMKRNEDRQLEPAQTWQVRRSEFDRDLMEEAKRRGARWLSGRAVQVRQREDGTVTGAQVKQEDGTLVEVESEVLVDASGQYTWLAHQGVTAKKNPGRYDKQIAIFSQVKNTIRGEGWDGSDRSKHPDNTYIFYADQYHWAWFIPLDDDVVSVGVVSPSSYFSGKGESREAFLRRELAELNPDLTRRLNDLTLIEEARAIPNYSFHISEFTGKGWICIGDTHRFIDPIFSFGLYISMKEAQFAAPLIKRYLEGEGRDLPNPFVDHMVRMETAIDHLQDLIDGFWGAATSFAYIVNNPRTRDQMIDLFAGRIYDVTPQTHPAITELRALAEKARASGTLFGEDRRGSGFVGAAS